MRIQEEINRKTIVLAVSAGLKNKLCKCNKHQNSDNTKNAVKQGNAEERPDAGCEIKR